MAETGEIITKPKRSKIVTPKEQSRADRNIAWIEHNCFVPEGKFVGQPVILRAFQKEIIHGIFDTPTRRVIVSMAKKNAKTALSSMIMLLYLCGPEVVPNGQIISASQSSKQAAIVYDFAAKMIRMNPNLSRHLRLRDTIHEIACPEVGTLYRAVSADAKRSQGFGPCLVIHDELGQNAGARSPLYETLEASMSAQVDPLSICISTQAATDADLFSILIDDAKKGLDPKVKLFMWTADMSVDPFSVIAMKQANPAYGDFQTETEMLEQAESARRMPSSEPSYRNFVLNQRVEMDAPFCSKSIWDANNFPVDDFEGVPVWGGLDLSETSDLTALVLIAYINGKWNVRPYFWLPEIGLIEKGLRDRVDWDAWRRSGHLLTTPGKAIEYSYVADFIRELYYEYDIKGIAFDRFNMRHLKPWLEKSGFDEVMLETFHEMGQGFVSMSPALRTLEETLLNEKIAHANNPILTMCCANAVVERDPAGNRKLSKRKAKGRIDGMVSLAMALSLASTEPVQEEFVSIFDLMPENL